MTQQRRLDRILSDDYLDGIEEVPAEELRRLRSECEEEESGLSYARRMLQGKLDIVRAEVSRRAEAGEDTGGVQERLAGILGGENRTSGTPGTRVTRHLVPPAVRYDRREIDRIADDEALAHLQDRSTEELSELVGRLAERERELSDVRRSVLDRIDAIQDELTRRYKTGTADVGDAIRNRL